MYHIYFQREVCGNSRIYSNNLAIYVVIERDTKEEADIFAEDLGIYFDGIRRGFDQACCGDRWVYLYSKYNVVMPSYDEYSLLYYKDMVAEYNSYYTPSYLFRIHNKNGSIISSKDFEDTFEYLSNYVSVASYQQNWGIYDTSL